MTETLARSAIAPVPFSLYARDFDGFSQALGRSFARYGFAVISDHGLDQGRIDAAVADAKAFFALPDEVKRRYKIDGVSGQRGYTPFGVETAKGAAHFDLKEFWHVGRELPPGGYESYPVPEEYGVPEHHYAIVNGRPVIFHPQTRRIIHVY